MAMGTAEKRPAERTTIRLATGALLGGLLLGGLTACTAGTGGDASASAARSSAAASPSGGVDVGSVAESNKSGSVTCSGVTCSATLTQDGTKLTVFGATISLGSLQNGTATIGVGGKTVSCSQGQSVSVGPLQLTCSTVTDQKVTVTARLT